MWRGWVAIFLCETYVGKLCSNRVEGYEGNARDTEGSEVSNYILYRYIGISIRQTFNDLQK